MAEGSLSIPWGVNAHTWQIPEEAGLAGEWEVIGHPQKLPMLELEGKGKFWIAS